MAATALERLGVRALDNYDPRHGLKVIAGAEALEAYYRCSAAIWMGTRIASPGMLLEADRLPHLICSRPIFIGGVKNEADQHDDA
jgi:hypothetical protein